MVEPILKLIDVSKCFKDDNEFEALKNINLTVKDGEFVCILGPSGCGKTILLHLIAGFLMPSSGQILIEDKPVKRPNPCRMMIFQDYVLFPWKTVYGNIAFALSNINISRQKKDELIMKYLNLVGLTDFKDWYVYKLSGGMKQRVALARALIVNPKILLMDEPFAALDSQYRKFLRKSLEEIWQKTKKTIIFVTHSISEAIYLSDKIYIMSERPTTIKKVYQVNLPRPRKLISTDFLKLREEIEIQVAEEFEKTVKNQIEDKSLDSLLEVNL